MRVFKTTLCLDGGDADSHPPKQSRTKIKAKLVDNLRVASGNSSYEESSKHCRLLLNASNVVVASGLDKTSTTPGSGSTTDASSVEDSVSSSGSGVKTNRKSNKGVTWLMVFGVINLLIGVLSLIWTPFNIFMVERLRMVPGFPPYEWWRVPPDEVLMRVYVFNITNGDAFMAGADAKLRYEEIGPFVFLEKLVHTDITFHDNGTMTYVARRTAIFLPEMTSVGLDAVIVVPNLAVLGMASKMHDSSFFTKFGFNMLVKRHNSAPLVSVTIDDYFWNFTDPLIATGKKLLPHLVPADNMAILHRIYSGFTDEVTVYMGPDNAHRFFTMSEFHGSPRFNFWPDERCDSVEGGTEGVTYPQMITRNDSLNYFRKTICRITPVQYVADVRKNGLDVFRFELPYETFHRPPTSETDCFSTPGQPALPDGVTNVSPCYFGFPIASSMPHFLGGDQSLVDAVEGIQPIREKHESFVIVEPTTGVPMESRARSQSNLVMRRLRGFGDLGKFSDVIMPMFWIEYNQVGLPWYVMYLMYFTVKVLPTCQTYISYIQLFLGCSLLAVAAVMLASRRRKTRPRYQYSSLDLIPSIDSSDC